MAKFIYQPETTYRCFIASIAYRWWNFFYRLKPLVMKPALRLLLLGCCLTALPAHSQIVSWQHLNGPFGGHGEVYAGKQGYIFMALHDNVLYRSADNGITWQKMPPTPADIWYWPLTVAPDGNLYAGKIETLYRSVDQGQTWGQIGSVYHDIITALPSGEMLVATAFPKEIKRSTDGGQTWATVSSGIDAAGGFAYDSATDVVYAWSSKSGPADSLDHVLRSTDQGQTWTVMLARINLEPFQMAFAPNGSIFVGGSDLLWRSTDNGANWTALEPAMSSDNYQQMHIAALPTGRLLAFEWYLSKYSDDNGATWQPLEDGVGNVFSHYTVLPNGTVFAQRGYNSLHRSTDNGQTWTFAANGVLRSSVSTLQHIDEARMLALTLDGLFYSEDSGSSWTLIWTEINGRNSYLDGSLMLSLASDGTWYLWNGVEVIKFTNEGQDHTILNTGTVASAGGNFNGLWTNPYQNGTLYIASSDGLHRSVDGGSNWNFINSFSPAKLFFLTDGSLLANQGNTTFKSTDGGATWLPLARPPISYVAPTDEVYSLDNSTPALFYSPDGGLTWDSTAISSNATLSEHLTVNTAGYLFLLGGFEGIVFRSVDNGRTFNPLPQAAVSTNYGDKITLNSSQHLFQTVQEAGIYRSSNPTTQVKLLSGNIFHDLNDDCALANPDTVYPGRLLKATSNNETVYGYTNPTGRYTLPINAGSYQLKVVMPQDYWLSCNGAVSIPASPAIGVVDSAHVGLRIAVECPYAEVNITAPFLRRCFPSQVYVNYRNSGTVPAQNAYLEITLDSSLLFNNASLPVAAQHGFTYQFLLGNLAVNQTGVLTLNCTPSCNAPLGYVHCLTAHIFPDTLCPPLHTPQLRTSAVCLGDSIQLRIENVGAAAMTAPQSWYAFDQSNFFPPYATLGFGEVQLPAGGSFVTRLPALYPTVDFTVRQDPQYPYNTSSTTTIRGCAPGSNEPLSIINEDEEGPATDAFCQRNIGAFDPNDKTGFPAGLAAPGFIEREQSLEYLIRFQNTGTDTAFNITVRDTLSVLLDPASVEVVASSQPCQLRLTPEGVVLFSFEHIMLPDSNTNEPASHGFVQFRIRQQPNNSFGSTIHNRAAIYFDFNTPVLTNTTRHTVGIPVVTGTQQAPTSALATVQCSPNPFHTTTTLTLKNAPSAADGFLLELFDTAGKQQRQLRFSGEQTTWQRGDLPDGLYYYVVKMADSGAVVGSGSVVMQ